MSQENESGRRKSDVFVEAERQMRLALAVERTNDKIERTNQDLVRVSASVDGLVDRVTTVVDRVVERLEGRVNEIGAHLETRLDRIDSRIDKLDDDIVQLQSAQAQAQAQNAAIAANVALAAATSKGEAKSEDAPPNTEQKQSDGQKNTAGIISAVLDRLDGLKIRTWILAMVFLLVAGAAVGVFTAVRDALKNAGLGAKAASADHIEPADEIGAAAHEPLLLKPELPTIKAAAPVLPERQIERKK